MTGITAPCTCSVDGVSGLADTRYQGYSFTGCGAHVDYTLNTFEGGGYERTWCYVTSPPDCPGESPYIPEGFKTDNTLPEWEALGAAWKECYDGYRCEAWWGGLEGSPDGEPVVLDAPLDWPDCCALCSGGGGSDDGDGSGTNSTCVAWSFDPSTGSCQRMSTVEEPSYDYSWDAWNNNNTINGYPGYFEAPLTDCWGRSQYDLCVNTNAAFIIPGVIVAFISLCCMWASGFCAPSTRAGLLRELAIEQPQSSRLVKVACAEVACTKTVKSTGKGGTKIIYTYKGTFVTRDGAVYNLPPPTRRPKMNEASRRIEERMLSVLHNTKRNPRADPSLARRCETPDGLRAEFSKMVRAVPKKPEASRSGGSFYRSHVLGHPNVPIERDGAVDQRFDCILLVGTEEPGRTPTKVLLVGILGEDRITCVGEDVLGTSVADLCCASFCFVLAAALLFIMCITLLTNEAAQNMAAWTFEGDHRIGAIIGLVLCTCVPLSLFVWKCRKSGKLLRSIRECPLVAESDRVINSRT